jgi:hypothetical protein
MEYGICQLSIIPCRKEPSDRSEMVSQLLFGETFELIEKKEKWVRIRNTHDTYESWIGSKQYLSLTEAEYLALQKQIRYGVNEIISIITDKTKNLSFPCVAGSLLPSYEEDNFEILDQHFNYEGEIFDTHQKSPRSWIAEKSYEFLNAPYLWGGRSVLGIDCSGFTQLIYRMAGYAIPRDAWQQAENGKTLSFLDEVKEGDLAFFDNEEGRIIHVGIVLPDHQIIHASGMVRIDKLDHYGIYQEESKSYSHRLRLLKTFIED